MVKPGQPTIWSSGLIVPGSQPLSDDGSNIWSLSCGPEGPGRNIIGTVEYSEKRVLRAAAVLDAPAPPYCFVSK
uniref:Uncharacterized protein n=1 Tax=Arundo donax TaxID=35708 RepID=A0A0A9G5M1_ARUDO